ncbi:MAG: HEPN domain-containing protein [Bacteroidales bacterium]|jgi:HEPN domain-containing protein/predicted nucleotidyltransferase|nr:HEPN domain-containing protein [Bacteroidales bacterium]
MKKTITHLPKKKQEDLQYFIRRILGLIPQTQMIILYGSYATGKYVEYDSRIEFGIQTSFMSDYDILVVTHDASDMVVKQKLERIENIYYKNPDNQTPVQFINDDIKKLNKDLSDGRYFSTQVKKEGIMLYDSGKFKLARRRKLRYDEIQQQAQGYFKEKFKRANNFLKYAVIANGETDYKEASFFLHQACESLFFTVRLVFTLKNSKQHNLAKLLASVRRYSSKFDEIFPRKTEEEKRLFLLLKQAYIQARYNPKFVVTKEDIDALIPLVQRLFALVETICTKQIAEYGAMK